METIYSYMNNVFKTLPDTEEIRQLKEEILNNMEEKYNELKAQGKSENEAIGIVISEFGNIDELLNEMGGIKEETNENAKKSNWPVISDAEVDEYLDTVKKSNVIVGIGVALCILSPTVLIFMSGLSDFMKYKNKTEDAISIVGVLVLLCLIGVAVGLFIFSGTKTDKYKFIDNGEFGLSGSTKKRLSDLHTQYKPVYSLRVGIGVVMCILSPTPVLISSITDNDFYAVVGVDILLCVIAVAVYNFITNSSYNEPFQKLLKIEDYKEDKREKDRVVGAVASIVWPLTVVVFLIAGFVYNAWGICWIVFPIVGILFGGFSACYSALKAENRG